MKRLLIAASALSLAACTSYGTAPIAGQATVAAQSADLVIENVTVISPDTGSKLAGQDVAIRGGRIISVAPTATSAFVGAKEIDGTGRYLIPGLFDMHSHASFRPVHVNSLKLMHANGVTGVREMGSDCRSEGGIAMCLDEMIAARAKIEKGELIGPRLVQLSTAKVDMERGGNPSEMDLLYTPQTAAEANASMAFYKGRGAEFIKIAQSWTPETFAAFMAEAKAQGLPVGGHIPMTTSVKEAAALGVTSIEHARDLPMDCAKVGGEFRDQLRRKLSGENVDWPNRRAVPGRSVAEYDAKLCAEQVEAMAAHGTYYVPTHLTREMDYRASEKSYRDDARLKYLPSMQINQWNKDLDRTASAPAEMIADLTAFYALGLKTTKLAHDAGVKVMVGTDANDTMIFPGFSVHDELAALVQAGLTPMEALAAATSVPADYLDRERDFGGVSAGKLADLVLLDADPTADIANTTKIAAVIQGGRVSDRAALDALLAEVEASVAVTKAQ